MGGEVIVISMGQEFTLDQHIREKFHNALMRAERHAPRIKGIDLVDIENRVEANLLESQLTIDDHLLGLLDLINYCKNGRSLVHITPENMGKYLSLANTLTLNGIYLSNFLAKRNIDSFVILNYYAEKGDFFNGVKYKSLETLKRELKSIPQDGSVRHIRFTDDNFTASKEKLRETCQMMIEEDFRFGWSSFARPDAITDEIAALMSRAKCEFLEMGIES